MLDCLDGEAKKEKRLRTFDTIGRAELEQTFAIWLVILNNAAATKHG
jgi:hypothetical protein